MNEPTTEVSLEPVTEDNWRSCAALTVRPDQADHVARSPTTSACAPTASTWQPLAIVRGDGVVGFCMWASTTTAAAGSVASVRSTPAVQRTGVARAHSSRSSSGFEAEPGLHRASALSYSPDNVAARRSVRRTRFVETGRDRG